MRRLTTVVLIALAGLLAVGPGAASAADRARIIWNQANDIDLHVYDDAANHAFYSAPTAIPDAVLSEDVTNAGGPEVFTDNRAPSTRPFGYRVCYYDGDQTGAGPTQVTLTLTSESGAVSTDTFTLPRPGNCHRAGTLSLIPADVDEDDDSVLDETDNCPDDNNSGQEDTDGDGVGNACDVTDDTDGDLVLDGADNCPGVPNAGQEDANDNGVGDACEITDSDGDGVTDNVDNCDDVDNPGQEDGDGNGIGDACDGPPPADGDGDGVADAGDNCPSVPNPDQADGDGDGLGDFCDPPPEPTPPPVIIDPIPTIPEPVLGKTVVATKVGSGRVRIRLRNGKFRTLGDSEAIPFGSEVDATKGRVRLTSVAGRDGKLQTADFYKGAFIVTQTKGSKPITDLKLSGKLSCPRKGKASTSAKKKVRRLWGDGKGRFRTRGRRAAATVRGTKWLTEDRCDRTKITVRRGKVSVRDLVKKRTKLVKQGRSYVARSR